MRFKYTYILLSFIFCLGSCGIFGGDEDGENESPNQNPKPSVDPHKGKIATKFGNKDIYIPEKHQVTLNKLLGNSKDISNIPRDGTIAHRAYFTMYGRSLPIPAIENATVEERDAFLGEFFEDLKNSMEIEDFKNLINSTNGRSGKTPYADIAALYAPDGTDLTGVTRNPYRIMINRKNSKLLNVLNPDKYN